MDITTKYYSDNAKDYAQKFDRSGPRVKEVNRAFELCGMDNPRVLELGCANGRDAEIILEKTKNYLGVDGAEGLLDIFRNRFPDASVKLADFRTLTFPEQSFDIVFDFASLFHLDKLELKNILRNIHGWLRKNGILVTTGKYGEYQKFINPEQGNKIQYFYKPEIIFELASNFEIVEQKIEDMRGQAWYILILRKTDE